MAVIATDSTRFSAVVKHEYEPQVGFCREVVTMNDSAATIKVGTVLGKVTATGKYKVSRSAAGDGSEVPVAVFIADIAGNSGDLTLAATTDTKVLVLARGPAIVADAALTLGTGTTAAVAKAGLLAVNILVETAI